MSSKSVEKKFVKFEYKEEDYLDLKHCIIPFSYFFRRKERFIYDGNEKIPFRKRDSLYKSIFLQEFKDSIKMFKNNRKNY